MYVRAVLLCVLPWQLCCSKAIELFMSALWLLLLLCHWPVLHNVMDVNHTDKLVRYWSLNLVSRIFRIVED